MNISKCITKKEYSSIKLGEALKISWIDACTYPEEGWTELDDLDSVTDFLPVECITLGIVTIKEDSHLVVHQTQASNGAVAHGWVIPSGWITKIERYYCNDEEPSE